MAMPARPSAIMYPSIAAAVPVAARPPSRGGDENACVILRDRARRTIVTGLDRVDDAAGAGAELRDRTRKDDPAGAKHRHRVAQILDLVKVVAAQDDRGAAGGQIAHERARVTRTRRIERAGRLVEQQQARRAQQRGGQAEPLAHAGRIRADRDVRKRADSRSLDRVGHQRTPARPSRRASNVRFRRPVKYG